MLSRVPLIYVRHRGRTLPLLSRVPLIYVRHRGRRLPLLSRVPLIYVRHRGRTLPSLGADVSVAGVGRYGFALAKSSATLSQLTTFHQAAT